MLMYFDTRSDVVLINGTIRVLLPFPVSLRVDGFSAGNHLPINLRFPETRAALSYIRLKSVRSLSPVLLEVSTALRTDFILLQSDIPAYVQVLSFLE